MSQPFLGEIKMFTGNFAPRGWAACDGGTLPSDQNMALFSLIGTIYGGDATNFKLPDMRGRAVVHTGQATGLSNYNLGDTGGVETVTLTEAQLPSHSHLVRSSSGTGTLASPAGAFPAVPNAGALYKPSGTSAPMASSALTSTPSGAHNNMQAFVGVNFIIAIAGIYPG